jgi:hypothetical protein
MAWHSDGDMSLAEQTTIASLSLGATRKFVFGISVPKKKLKCCCNRVSSLSCGCHSTALAACDYEVTENFAARINLTLDSFCFKSLYETF